MSRKCNPSIGEVETDGSLVYTHSASFSPGRGSVSKTKWAMPEKQDLRLFSGFQPQAYIHALSLSLSHTHTLTHTHSLTLTHTLTHTHTQTHTHTHTHTFLKMFVKMIV